MAMVQTNDDVLVCGETSPHHCRLTCFRFKIRINYKLKSKKLERLRIREDMIMRLRKTKRNIEN